MKKTLLVIGLGLLALPLAPLPAHADCIGVCIAQYNQTFYGPCNGVLGSECELRAFNTKVECIDACLNPLDMISQPRVTRFHWRVAKTPGDSVASSRSPR